MSESRFPTLRRSNSLAAAACVLIVICTMLWPGDAPWGGDDRVLIHTAITANREHRLVPAGLGGSFGYPYGPIPEQIYQVLALFSHNPIVLVRLHAALLAGCTGGALLYLSSVLGLSWWYAPLVMLGPFFWFYTRLMWDNTFAIPVGTLLLAGYGDFLRRGSGAAFLTAAMCAVALPLIHPMTLPLVTAVAGHALLAHRGEFIHRWRGLAILAICTVVLCGPYCLRITRQMGHSPGLVAPRDDALTRPQAMFFPLWSGRLFTANGFFDARGPEAGLESNQLVVIAREISTVAYPLIWIGILTSLFRLREKVTIPTICVAALLLQSAMDARLRISPYPHYYCGTWAAIVVLLWIGLDRLRMLWLRLPVALIYAGSLLVATIAFAIDIHRQHGGKVWYGPSLESQLRSSEK